MDIVARHRMNLGGEWNANVNYYDDGAIQLCLYAGYRSRKDFNSLSIPWRWPWRWGESVGKRADRLVKQARKYIQEVENRPAPHGVSVFEEWAREQV